MRLIRTLPLLACLTGTVSSAAPAAPPGAVAPAVPAEPSNRQELVVLRDGSMFQGDLVEKVVGDHITLKLATGETRRFKWADLDQPPPLPPTEEKSAGGDSRDPPPMPPAVPASPEERYVSWPKPDRTGRSLRVQHLNVGAGVGWDFPIWFPVNVLVEYEPFDWLGVELNGRYLNPFGPSLGETVHFGLPLYDVARIGVGVGFQQSFLVRSGGGRYAYGGAPASAHFLNIELFQDSFFGPNIALRAVGGIGVLLNGNQYNRMCSDFSPECGPGVVPGDPWAAANGERVFGYTKLELMWRFTL